MSTKTKALTAMGTALLAPLASIPAAHAADAHTAKPATASTKLCAATTTAAQTHLAASSVQAVAGGGRAYVYHLGAQQLRFAVPPPGFDALRATRAQLARYGLPPRPKGAAALAKWTKLFGHLGRAATPELAIGPAQHDNLPTAAPARPGAQAGISTSTSSIWAGYVSKQWGQPTYYGNVQGEWVQPSIGATSCAGATHLTWVGIGGYGSSALLQDGTDQNNNAWFEYLGPNNTGVSITDFSSNLGIHAGDSVEASTMYLSGTAYWFVEDLTTGKYTTATLSNASSYYDGSSAEFIDERTTFGTTPSPLANYGSTHWTEAQAATSTQWKNPVPLTALPNVVQVDSVNPNASNKLLANTLNEGAFGTTFETVWKNCS
jgi:Peptidase A4 family